MVKRTLQEVMVQASLSYVHYKGLAENVPQIMATIGAFVRYLGMIEAMQTGRYVFAHWNNAIKRDYLDSFPSISNASMFSLPEELAQELQYLLTHSGEERKKILSAQEWASKQRWNKITDIYEDLWKK
jgi:glycosyltransferase involved in cell wall biosynthesis